MIIFILLAIWGAVNFNRVSVNDSIVSYLPNDTENKTGLDLMDQEFGSLQSINLMVENISLDQAETLRNDLSEIKNVDAVLFQNTEDYYKDNSTLYKIELSDLTDEELFDVKNEVG